MPEIKMTEEEARKILGKNVQEDGSLYNKTYYLSWQLGDHEVTLDDRFTAEQLMAIAWWMTNKGK